MKVSMSDENKIRKMIWARKDAVDAKLAELGFVALPGDERGSDSGVSAAVTGQSAAAGAGRFTAATLSFSGFCAISKSTSPLSAKG